MLWPVTGREQSAYGIDAVRDLEHHTDIIGIDLVDADLPRVKHLEEVFLLHLGEHLPSPLVDGLGGLAVRAELAFFV